MTKNKTSKARKTRKKPKKKKANASKPMVVMTIKGMGQMIAVKTTDAKFVVMTLSKDVVRSAGGAVVVDTIDIEPIVLNSEVKTLSKDTVDTKGCSIVEVFQPLPVWECDIWG
jgi:hypothetical protein